MNNKKLALCLIILLSVFSTLTFAKKDQRLELANLTVRYYQYLSTKNFKAINNMVGNNFSLSNIECKTRQKALHLLKKIYGDSHHTVELSNVTVLSYEDLQKVEKTYFDDIDIYKNVVIGDWITLVPKMKINGEISPTLIGLVFRKKGNRWYVVGMYRNRNLVNR